MASLALDVLIKNIPDDYIDSRHLRFVVRALHDVAVHWNSIGHQLKIANLDKIKHDYVTVSRCLIVMADSLLKGRFIELPGELATWKTIVKVIKAPSGGNYPLHAKRVATNLRDFQTFCPGRIAKDVDATSLYDIDLEQKQIVQKISENLVQAAARWFEIGALLGLPLNTLTTIKDEPHPNTNARMRRVVEEWLLQAEMLDLEPPSWQVLVDVVAHGAGGDDPGLAQRLAAESKQMMETCVGSTQGSRVQSKAAPTPGAVANSGIVPPPTEPPSKVFTVKSIGNAIATVTDWHELGMQLELPSHMLEQIRVDFYQFGTARQRNEMVALWLQMDTEASWNKLCSCLTQMNLIVLAAGIRKKYM